MFVTAKGLRKWKDFRSVFIWAFTSGCKSHFSTIFSPINVSTVYVKIGWHIMPSHEDQLQACLHDQIVVVYRSKIYASSWNTSILAAPPSNPPSRCTSSALGVRPAPTGTYKSFSCSSVAAPTCYGTASATKCPDTGARGTAMPGL